jgi:Flp pilus assembly protein TadD
VHDAALTREQSEVAIAEPDLVDLVDGHAAPLATEVKGDAVLGMNTVGAGFFCDTVRGAEDGLKNIASHGGDRPRVRGVRQALGMLTLLFAACVHPEAVRGRRALDERAYAPAADALQAAVRDRPTELSYWVDLGRAYVGKGDAERAEHAFNQACSLAPREPRLHIYLGHAYELGRRYDAAETAYRKAIALAPGRAWPLRVLGARLLRWGREADALPLLQRALKLEPSHAETHNAVAIALAKLHHTSAAEAVFRAAIAQFPTERSLQLGLAILLVNQQRLVDALSVYEGIVLRWPLLAPAHVARAVLHEELGHKPEARAALLAALRIAPNNPDYQRRLAVLNGTPHAEDDHAELQR